MSREPRDGKLLGDALAVGAAILAFALTVFLDSRPDLSGPGPPAQALAGLWTLNPERSEGPGGDRAGPPGEGPSPGGPGRAESLRIDVDLPLVMIGGEGEVRSLFVGGPPVAKTSGGAGAAESVSWGQEGLVFGARGPAGTAFIETFRVEGDGNCRLLRTFETPVPNAAGKPARQLVYDRAGEATRSGIRPSILAATVTVALALVLAVERAVPGTAAR
jgi:hypothetical protein